MPANDQLRLGNVLASMVCEPWLISPAAHEQYLRIVLAHAAGGDVEAAQHAMAVTLAPTQPRKGYSVDSQSGVAVMRIEGPILRKVCGAWQASGLASVDAIAADVEQATDDDSVRALVMAFDSCGGVAMGVPEAAAAIRAMQVVKPVVAYVDGLADSAAYWLASQASAVYMSPSSRAGGVGVYMALLDESRAYAMHGVERVLIRSGEHKGMGMPGTAITAEQRAMLQERVDVIGAQFRAAVNSRRPRVSADSMRGQDFDSAAAIAAGIADQIGSLATAVRDAATQTLRRGRGQKP
jgi:signal peptide peptidase SppA